jgi:methylglutaconyl-CoA hydratase
MTKADKSQMELSQQNVIQQSFREMTDVICISINRPNVHNALDDQVIEELTQVFTKLRQDSTVRAIVLAATGSTFSAGADLNWMKRVATYSLDKNVHDAEKLAHLLDIIDTSPIPTIACVQGAAYGGGVGLVAACDIAVCSNTASFCLSEVRWGLIPAIISPYLINAIGQRQARRYVLTADRMSSEEALRLGLVHQVVGEGELEATVESLAVSILKGSPSAIKASKELIRFVESRPIDAAIHKKTAQWIATIRSSHEGKEGIDAFLTKRTPSWVP